MRCPLACCRLPREQVRHGLGLSGEAQKDPLAEPAAEPDESLALGRHLDAFGDGLDSHASGHYDITFDKLGSQGLEHPVLDTPHLLERSQA